LKIGVVEITKQSIIILKSTNFWDITSCSPLYVNRRFGGTCHLHAPIRHHVVMFGHRIRITLQFTYLPSFGFSLYAFFGMRTQVPKSCTFYKANQSSCVCQDYHVVLRKGLTSGHAVNVCLKQLMPPPGGGSRGRYFRHMPTAY
jgi:hypothetical protein